MTVERVNPHGMPDTDRVMTFDDLALFLGGSRDSWTGLLLVLIAKSDPEHREALRAAFPVHVAVWSLWVESEPPPTVVDLTAAAHGATS